MNAAEQAEIACNIVHWQLQLVANPAGGAGSVLVQLQHRLELLYWHACIICIHSITLGASAAGGTAPGSTGGHVWGWAAPSEAAGEPR
jgi:hypothetical protein